MSKKKSTLPSQLVFIRTQVADDLEQVHVPLGALRAIYKRVPINQRRLYRNHPLADDRRHVIMPHLLVKRLIDYHLPGSLGIYKW